MSLCQYKDVFGAPRQGVHAARIPIVDLAFWDVLGTIILVVVLSYTLGTSLLKTAIATTVAFIFLHWLFCVDTTLTKAIF